MTVIRFFVPERPFAKQRPRFGRGRAWTPAETVAAEQAVRWYAKRVLPDGFVPFAGPVRVALEFRFARPRRQKEHVRVCRWHAHKPDLDNCMKVLDALSPTDHDPTWPGLWNDDCQIASVQARKLWATDARPEGTTIEIEPLTTGVEQ